MNLRPNETMESGPYPEHPGEPDCSYDIRTGLCRVGATCRFNHPPNRKLYYLKTGTCKFGATCRFHLPKDKAGIAGRVTLNTLCYPLRPNEPECAYYLRTGQCKFGNTCICILFSFPKMMLLSETIKEQDMYQLLVRKCREKGELVDQLLFSSFLHFSHNMYQMWIPMNWSI